MSEIEIPESHPRYESLLTRHRIETGVEKGITSQQGLIAQGRGETLDYLLGERTLSSADEAARVGATHLLRAKRPVLSVDGEATTQNVTLQHADGDSFSTDDLEIILRGNSSSERYDFDGFTQLRGTDNATFEQGDRWYRSHGIDSEQMEILVVDVPQNQILDRTDVEVTETLGARFETNRTNPRTVDTIEFDGSGSVAPDGEITNYKWDLGDGTTKSTDSVTHSYDSSGTYDVTLTVETSDGRTASRTTSIQVFEPTPGAAFSFEPQNPDKGEQIEFNASASSSPGTVIDTYEWDFGDGTVTTTSSETITHSYSAYDSYNVSLTVTDGNNRTSTTGDVVSVIDAGPAVFSVTTNATNAPITEGEDLTVDVDVNNTGGSTGTQNITLQRDSTGDGTADTQVDTQEVTNLGPDDGIRSITLEWGTQVGDDGENISINVTSEDDFDQGQVTVNQSQAGSITIQGDVTSAGGSGKVEFNLNNTGDINATLVALGINETTSTDATEVDKGVNLTAGGSQIISQLIDFDSSTPGQAQRYDFSSNVTLQPGESETFEFDKFRATNGNADMRGEDITTTLWLDDGSTATITLQVPSKGGGSGNNGQGGGP